MVPFLLGGSFDCQNKNAPSASLLRTEQEGVSEAQNDTGNTGKKFDSWGGQTLKQVVLGTLFYGKLYWDHLRYSYSGQEN